MNHIFTFYKLCFAFAGSIVGWIIGEFAPVFPLIVVAVVLIVYDAYTAFLLDKRVHKRYPEKVQRKQARFTSFAFGKVITKTIPKRLMLILLSYMIEHWVFIHLDIPLSYMVTGIICFEQLWSVLENESSCREEKESKFWKILQKIMIDKTERHLDVSLDEFKVKPEEPKEQKGTKVPKENKAKKVVKKTKKEEVKK